VQKLLLLRRCLQIAQPYGILANYELSAELCYLLSDFTAVHTMSLLMQAAGNHTDSYPVRALRVCRDRSGRFGRRPSPRVIDGLVINGIPIERLLNAYERSGSELL
jgi:hypothetical protein